MILKEGNHLTKQLTNWLPRKKDLDHVIKLFKDSERDCCIKESFGKGHGMNKKGKIYAVFI